MDWNKFCFYALLCFTTPRPELQKVSPFCEFYQSEDGKFDIITRLFVITIPFNSPLSISSGAYELSDQSKRFVKVSTRHILLFCRATNTHSPTS